MKTRRSTKVVTSIVLGALLFSFQLCACEEALAAVQTATESCGRHESNGSHDHDTNSDDESSCCAKIIAVQDSVKLSSLFGDQTFFTGFVKEWTPGASVIVDAPIFPNQKFEFPPGASPPDVFLVSCFTHAPPATL